MKRLALILVAVAQVLAANCGAVTGTDIFDAVRAGDVEKVKALLQVDPKLAEVRTEDGSTALHVAALEGHATIAALLLASKAQVNARGLREETPLHMAMYDGHREMAELLLANQADVNAQNTDGQTPLHLAASKGHRELVELLLSQNADPGARDKAGRTPKAVATEKGHQEIVEVLTLRVGDLGDLQRLVFEGAKVFSAESLRQGLQSMRDFFEVSHPLAPLDAYLEAIERKLRLGYQHHGFHDARIEVRHDVRAGRIVVKLEEGPRYLCGAVKVTGAQKMPAAAIVERLTLSQAPTKSVQAVFNFMDKAPTSSPLTEVGSKEPAQTEAFWVKGEPAPFSEVDLRRMKILVTDALHEHGFLFAKANVTVVPDKAARTAELQVEVLEEGPRGVIDRIEVAGNKQNTQEALLRYLDLKPGMELSSQLVSAIEDRLWRAARFLSYKVSLGSPDAGGRVPLQIEVVEYDEAPPLDQEFNRVEQTMLKVREWLSNLDDRREDMTINLTNAPAPAPELELVLSPLSGLALLTKDPTRPTAARDEYAIIFKAGLMGLYSPVGGHKLLMTCSNYQLKVSVSASANPSVTNGSPFNLNVGAGFNSLTAGDSNASPYQFQLALPPVFCVGMDHGRESTNWFEGDTLIRSNATFIARFDTRTGRILEFRTASDEGKGMLRLRFVPGAFERAVQRIEAGTANLRDASDTNAPLSSAAAFLAEEVLASRYLAALLPTNTSSKIGPSLPAALRQFRLGEVLAPLDQLVRASSEPARAENFWIPEDAVQTTGNSFVVLFAGWLLRHNDELFATRSCPWTILREAGLFLQGRSKYTGQTLKGIYESNETGPLGCLAVTELLNRLHDPLARKFAARGLERLSPADFRRDCQMFLTGNSVASQCCQRLAAALRDLDNEHLTALAKEESPALGEFLREGSRRLRAANGQPMLEALGPALDSYWESELKAQVANLLRGHAIDVAGLFKEGLAAYQTTSPDKAEAAKLFQRAADRGHSGAQYYLGMIYEKGAGVTKDVAAALNWYRQAATNGYVEASVTLGNFYSDGLEVTQDYAEAFVWYGVAAAQGNWLAEALRKSMQRKLTAEQLAEAGKRVSVILANRLPPTDVSEPASSGGDN
jgi:Ankyrin repeats (3 copies)/Sel1 repeat/Ankyrin repeat